ncbi:MAG: hypothetical protein ABJI96_09330 [Paracoccaceae bacterium]
MQCGEHASLPFVVSAAETVTGKVTKARDADTVVVKGLPIRLNGIDTPENDTLAGDYPYFQ